jgi:glutamate dehydrogenase/leucine dehydrogenase
VAADPSGSHGLWRGVLRERSLCTLGDTIKGKTFVLSGFGNVDLGRGAKARRARAVAIAISGPDGYVHDRRACWARRLNTSSKCATAVATR